MSFTGDFGFKKVEIEARRTPKYNMEIGIKKGTLTIPTTLVELSGWKPGDRVDLLQCGSMFALEKSNSGVFTLRRTSQTSQTLVISSINLCRHIRTVTHEDCTMVAKVDGNRVIFYKTDSR